MAKPTKGDLVSELADCFPQCQLPPFVNAPRETRRLQVFRSNLSVHGLWLQNPAE